MATVTHAVATNVDTANTPNSSSAFTPVAGDLLVVITDTSTSTSTALGSALTASANGITFAAVLTSLYDSSTDKLCVFVAEQLVPASPVSMTVTWSPSDAGQQSIHSVFRISGMTRTGLDAVKQFTTLANRASATTPSITFTSSCLTGNPTILAIGVADSTPAFTAPAGWTETSDTGGTSPAGGLWDGSRNSGFTGTTVTWSSAAGAGFAVAGIEFDTSAPPGPDPALINTFEDDSASGVTTLSSGSISVTAGDLLVVKGVVTGGGTINTPTATGLTFTLQATGTVDASRPTVNVWTATCPSTTSVTVAATTSANQKAFIVEQWRGMHLDATPATSSGAWGVPSTASLTTEAADSVISWVASDWNESATLSPTYTGTGTTILEFSEHYSGAWTWWTQHGYGLSSAGIKTISWSAPGSMDGTYAAVEIQRGGAGTDATATPAVISTTVAAPRSSDNVAAGPAATATVTALARAGVNTAAGPAALSASASLPRAALNVTAGPAVAPAVAALPLATAGQAGTPATATPAAITTNVTVPGVSVNVAADPATISAAVAAPRAAVNTAASPTTTAVVVGLPRAAVAAAAGPAAAAVVAALPRTGVNTAAAPAATSVAIALPQTADHVTTTPAIVPVSVTVPSAAAVAGGNVTAQPSTITVTVGLPAATVMAAANATPGPVSAIVNLPRAAIPALRQPAVVLVAVTLPQATVRVDGTPTPAAITVTVTIPAARLDTAAGPSTIPVAVTVPLPSAGDNSVRPAVGIASVAAAAAVVAAVGQNDTYAGTTNSAETTAATASEGRAEVSHQ